MALSGMKRSPKTSTNREVMFVWTCRVVCIYPATYSVLSASPFAPRHHAEPTWKHRECLAAHDEMVQALAANHRRNSGERLDFTMDSMQRRINCTLRDNAMSPHMVKVCLLPVKIR